MNYSNYTAFRWSGKTGLVHSIITRLFLWTKPPRLPAQYILTRNHSILCSSLPQSHLASYCVHSVSFYSSLSGQQQSIGSYQFSFSQLTNRDIHWDVAKDIPVELQNLTLLSADATPSLTWNGWLCASRSHKARLSVPIPQSCWPFAPSHPWYILLAIPNKTSHFLVFPAAMHSSDNGTTMQLLILCTGWDWAPDTGDEIKSRTLCTSLSTQEVLYQTETLCFQYLLSFSPHCSTS